MTMLLQWTINDDARRLEPTNKRSLIFYSVNVPSQTEDRSNRKRPLPRGVDHEGSETARFSENLRQIIDRHALLVMRELSMNVRRFKDIQSQTKMGAALLTSRLRRLERDGIIERRRYNEHPPRYEYFATQKGRELDEFLFLAGDWNVRWGDLEEPSMVIHDKTTGKRLTAIPGERRKRVPETDR